MRKPLIPLLGTPTFISPCDAGNTSPATIVSAAGEGGDCRPGGVHGRNDRDKRRIDYSKEQVECGLASEGSLAPGRPFPRPRFDKPNWTKARRERSDRQPPSPHTAVALLLARP